MGRDWDKQGALNIRRKQWANLPMYFAMEDSSQEKEDVYVLGAGLKSKSKRKLKLLVWLIYTSFFFEFLTLTTLVLVI